VTCIEGAVNGEVGVELAGGQCLTAIVTNESIRNMGLKEGVSVCALVKASSVILAVYD
jgi:molybdate transport system regulatory protein